MNYQEFIKTKTIQESYYGFEVDKNSLNKNLFDFQRDIVYWSLLKGKAAIWLDCGLGKSICQLSWADQIYKKTNENILILAPLAVSKQTKREGIKFGIEVNICRSQQDIKDGINITNYEILHKFDSNKFVGVVLDESGILKNYSGKFRNQIINEFKNTKYKLCCTATPSPNDNMELGNHAEFLDIMTRTEMLSMFFVHDGGDTGKWRLKGHAESEFWKWLCSWAVYMRKPSDLGYEDNDFILPELKINEVVLKSNYKIGIGFFGRRVLTLKDRREARKKSLDIRINKIKELVSIDKDNPWLIWCDLNEESKRIKQALDNAIEITGSDKQEFKENNMIAFSENKISKLVTKPKIAGHGLNWQNCNNIIFAGLSDSQESYYQAIRRCWRFGQKKFVNVYIVLSDKEVPVLKNIKRKELQAEHMSIGMLQHMKDMNQEIIHNQKVTKVDYKPNIKMRLPSWL